MVSAYSNIYSAAVRAAKKQYFAATIKSSICRQAKLFRVVWGLLQAGPKDTLEPSEARCNEFARHFQNKIYCIRQDLDSSVIAGESSEVSRAQSCPVFLDEFQLVQLEDVD